MQSDRYLKCKKYKKNIFFNKKFKEKKEGKQNEWR